MRDNNHSKQLTEADVGNVVNDSVKRCPSQPPLDAQPHDQDVQTSLLGGCIEQTESVHAHQPLFRLPDGYVYEPAMESRTHTPENESAASTVSQHAQARLCISHFLSTWNSRSFEFGAVLFLAAIYPGTLRPMSIYALVRSAAAILLSQPVGLWIDRGNRLAVVRASIIGQRLAVAISCGLFWVMKAGTAHGFTADEKDVVKDKAATNGLFAAVVVMACVEKVCAMMNLVAVERDWVVAITESNEAARRALNARIRRIDLVCKLLGPLVISSVALASTLIAIWAVLAMNLLSVVAECVFIEQVYKSVTVLCRASTSETRDSDAETSPLLASTHATCTRPQRLAIWLKDASHHVLPVPSIAFYFRHSAFLPSFSLALLYLTVLSFSGQMITYLISVGYTPLYVGVARTVSTCFELSATWLAPRLMQKIGVVRGGIWSLSWQMMWLAVGLSCFFANGKDGAPYMGTMASATALAVCVALSRIGLWGYDLCAQNIVQDEVDGDYRGTFSTAEAAFQNLFEMLSYMLTVIFSQPAQFQWPAIISTAVVYAAGGLYAVSVRKRRGHLFHAPPCICEKASRDS